MYGLVLEGGGAKGSYQIGACKAIEELGIDIVAVTGTSIGALNGAMIVQGELERAYELWYDITPSKVFDIEDSRLEELRNLEISHDGLMYFMKKAKEIAVSKGLDITFIKKLFNEVIDEDRLRNSKMDFGFVTVSLSDMKPLELFLEDVPKGKVVEYLLASANLPAFKQEKIDGKHFMDGGFYDNLPLSMLNGRGYKDIIAIRTNAFGRTRKINDRDLKVRYISTEQDLGGLLDFNQKQARVNLKLGYFDVLKSFQGLRGSKFYIKPTDDEELFINFLMGPGEKAILELGESLGLKDIPYRRLLFEHIVPKFALLLEVGKESTYEELVIAILEFIALEYKLERFEIYSFKEFSEEIRRKVQSQLAKKRIVKGEEAIRLPGFVRQSDVLSRAVKDRILKEMIWEMFGEYLWGDSIAH